ncbi:Fungal specific transcription factor domain-containing protein [Cladophialophora immunda]|nr:Fungal specific transcription factor domain-containing protein [Cladophialophora immunda]
MPLACPDNVFITYSNPSELKSRQNRRAVSSFASKSYRPTSKRIVLDRTHYRPFVRRSDGETPPPTGPKTKRKTPPSGRPEPASTTSKVTSPPRETQPRDDCVLGSPMADPFTTYPISHAPYVPFLVDYFIRFLTPRFSPALAVETSRYLIWFNVALQNAELFHALIALSQVYYNIDVKGFGNTHWTALYHRGEALKQLRHKVETAKNADDDAAILTALWLMDVDVAHGDLHAYSMHKRAKERMVWTRGGIRKLSAELQDELLKSEFFLPLLLHGRFVCELTDQDDVLVRFKEDRPVKPAQLGGFQGLFSVIASKGLITSQAVEILQRIFRQLSREPHFLRNGSKRKGDDEDEDKGSPLPQPVDQAFNEMSRVLRITEEVGPQSLHHRLLLALLVYIFNFHNQPQLLPPVKTPSASSSLSSSSSSAGITTKTRHPYLDILSNVALELSQPSNPSDPHSVTEREVTLWTMVAIASASSFSPWRLEIPFMGHLIEWMEKDEDEDEEEMGGDNTNVVVFSQPDTSGRDGGGEAQTTTSIPRPGSGDRGGGGKNLEQLTACLRGYYLYGADKKTLRSLQKWAATEPVPTHHPPT